MVVSDFLGQTMDDKKLLNELAEFANSEGQEITPILNNFLSFVAKTGVVKVPWVQLGPLLVKKMEHVLKEFEEDSPPDTLPSLPNLDEQMYEASKMEIVEKLRNFNGTPFTIQRLCELVTQPRRHYKRIDKFIRGVEKNILVVSTCNESPESNNTSRAVNKENRKPSLDGAVGGEKGDGTVVNGDDEDILSSSAQRNDSLSPGGDVPSNKAGDVNPGPMGEPPGALLPHFTWPAPHENDLPLWGEAGDTTATAAAATVMPPSTGAATTTSTLLSRRSTENEVHNSEAALMETGECPDWPLVEHSNSSSHMVTEKSNDAQKDQSALKESSTEESSCDPSGVAPTDAAGKGPAMSTVSSSSSTASSVENKEVLSPEAKRARMDTEADMEEASDPPPGEAAETGPGQPPRGAGAAATAEEQLADAMDVDHSA